MTCGPEVTISPIWPAGTSWPASSMIATTVLNTGTPTDSAPDGVHRRLLAQGHGVRWRVSLGQAVDVAEVKAGPLHELVGDRGRDRRTAGVDHPEGGPDPPWSPRPAP